MQLWQSHLAFARFHPLPPLQTVHWKKTPILFPKIFSIPVLSCCCAERTGNAAATQEHPSPISVPPTQGNFMLQPRACCSQAKSPSSWKSTPDSFKQMASKKWVPATSLFASWSFPLSQVRESNSALRALTFRKERSQNGKWNGYRKKG